MKICDKENINAIPPQTPASKYSSEVVSANIITLAMTASELTIPQKRTFANNNVVALTGNILVFNAVSPSRVIFVAQKVFVKILKINTTNSANGKFTLKPIALRINDSNNV